MSLFLQHPDNFLNILAADFRILRLYHHPDQRLRPAGTKKQPPPVSQLRLHGRRLFLYVGVLLGSGLILCALLSGERLASLGLKKGQKVIASFDPAQVLLGTPL